MSTEYHKISTPFKRNFDGPNKGKLIIGDWAVPELEYLANNEWEFTEKVDGTNIRIDIARSDDYVVVGFAGRTDNANIPKPLLQWMEETFTPEHVGPAIFGDWKVEALRNTSTHVTLYGEGYGPKIQNGGLYRKDQSFVLFDVKIGDWWLLRDDVDDIAAKLGIDSVPVLGYGTLADAVGLVKGTGTSAYMKSQWGDFEAEGIVARPTVPLFTRQGHRIITKIKAVDFR